MVCTIALACVVSILVSTFINCMRHGDMHIHSIHWHSHSNKVYVIT